MRRWIGTLLGLVLAIGLAGAGRATDLASMQPPEIEALQKRLTDDGCYQGPIDGQASPATQTAIKACPDQDPVLRIETGMHVAEVDRIGVDSACRLLATASEDRTVRLWSIPDGRLQQTIRLPIGPGFGGELDAVALSPDGRYLAAGGWDAGRDKGLAYGIYLIDLAAGTTRRFAPLEDVTSEIRFSPDGRRLAWGMTTNGLRVFDAASGRPRVDRNYGDRLMGLVFARDGSLYTTSFDGFVRRYGPNLTLAGKVRAPGGRQPYGISLDASGRHLAVGYIDTAAVSILDATTLKPLAQATSDGTPNGNFGSVTWSGDGTLIAGGTAQAQFDGTPHRFLRRFTASGKRAGDDVPLADNTVHDLQPCGASVAYVQGGPSFGLVDPEGKARTLQDSVIADMRNKEGVAFSVTPDATGVVFGLGFGADRPASFELGAGLLSEPPAMSSPPRSPLIDGLAVANWESNTQPTLDGRPISMLPHEVARSLAIRPDRAGFVLGTGWYLRAYDARGLERWKTPSFADAWGVNFSADGNVVVVAYGDGTIRWHRWSDGRELLALFVNAKDKRWVAWTPAGYYMASPGGEDMIGWHINRGWEQQADFFPASRFRDKFSRPDIVRLVLKTLDEGEAVRQANAVARKPDETKPLIESLPPVVTIVSPAEGASAAPGALEIRYTVRLPSGGALDRVEAFVDGARIEARGLTRADAGLDGSVSVPMPAQDAVISLVAYAGGKASDAVRLDLKGSAPTAATTPADDDALKPSLYALLVGVSRYDNKAYDLGYPADDASGIAEALKAQEGKLYRHVEVKVLTDKEATQTGVKRGLSWLRKQTTARDLAIVFAAGHGMTDAKGRFWFLTSDADPDELSTTAVSQQDIADVLFDLPGKKLLFLDACHSGAALNEGTRGLERTDVSAAVNDFAQTEGGVVAYAASTGREFSLERAEWGHGAFTKALIEGLDGKADLLHKGTVTTATLDAYLEDRVKELTGGAQHPVMTRPKTVPDFPIAVSN